MKTKQVLAPSKAAIKAKFPDMSEEYADIMYRIFRMCGELDFTIFPTVPINLLLVAAEHIQDRDDFIDQVEQRLRKPNFWTH